MPWLEYHDPAVTWRTRELTLVLGGRQVVIRGGRPVGLGSAARGPEIHQVSAKQIQRDMKRRGTEGILFMIREKKEESRVEPIADAIPDAQLQEVLKEFSDVLVDGLPPGLPPSRPSDHRIELIPGEHKPPHRPTYRLSPAELQEARRQIEDLLDKCYIRPSRSPYGAPILFARKKNGGLRMCIDYRGLNNLTRRNSFPIPRIDELLESLTGARVFSKLDLAAGYHQIRVKEEDIEKTAFNTRYGHFEWLVMSFGLTNAPATFQSLMNDVFEDLIGHGVPVYLDDVLVYSRTREEHYDKLREVLSRLRGQKLYAQRSKCEFLSSRLEYLGHLIDKDGIRMDPKKVSAIQDWPVPKTVADVQSFLGLASYYRRFVQGFARIAAPLTSLLQKSQAWAWGNSQQQDQGRGLQPIAYFSRKLRGAELNWSTHEKEALAQVQSIETTWQLHPEWAEKIKQALDSDLEARTARQKIRENDENWVEQEGLLFFKGRVYIPNVAHVRLALLQEAHEAPSAAHPGITRTYDALAALYYWKSLREDVQNFVTTCDVCQRVKAPRTKPGTTQGVGDEASDVDSVSSSDGWEHGERKSDNRGYAEIISTDYIRARTEAIKHARQNILEAKNRQKQQADKHRRSQIFSVGDLVMLATRHLQLPGVCKLTDRGTPPARPPPDLTHAEPEYEVEAILRHRQVRRRLQFLVLWKGYPLHDATWEPLQHLDNFRELLGDYVRHHGLTVPGFEDEATVEGGVVVTDIGAMAMCPHAWACANNTKWCAQGVKPVPVRLQSVLKGVV